jgi:poly-gamma-glutamate synthesis protein (capsule biosynthesis protein)
MYFEAVGAGTGELLGLWIAPLQIRHFRLNRASPDDSEWLKAVLQRESRPRGLEVRLQ